MLLRHSVSFAVLLFLCGGAAAQSKFVESAAQGRAALDAIVGCIAVSDYSCAWKKLRPLSVVPAAEFDAFEAQFNGQLVAVIQKLGKPIDFEFLREQKLASSLAKYEFIVRHEKAPMHWTFTMYRTNEGWVVLDFNFDGDLERFFDSK